ncbi:MAG: hypothetical protein U0359_11130 [Byssovorax sp.]
MSKPSTRNLVEVYEVTPGKGRPGYGAKPGALEFLPADAPLPQVGDIILLPPNMTGDTEDQAYVMGMVAPFRVVEREFLYFRSPDEKHDPINTKPAEYRKVWIHVHRISEDEYEQDPGAPPIVAQPGASRRR